MMCVTMRSFPVTRWGLRFAHKVAGSEDDRFAEPRSHLHLAPFREEVDSQGLGEFSNLLVDHRGEKTKALLVTGLISAARPQPFERHSEHRRAISGEEQQTQALPGGSGPLEGG